MCGQRGRGENDCSFESLLGRRSSHRGDETGRANDLFPTEFLSPRFAVPSLSFQRPAVPQPFAVARTQGIPLTALCCFRGSERTEIAVPPLSASRSCHSYLIAAGVPAGSGRGSTST